MKLQQSFAAIVVMAALACHAEESTAPISGGCDRPPDPPASESVVATPDYTAQAEDVEDASVQARANAWSEYQRSVREALAGSADPRDWATASLMPDPDVDAAAAPLRDNRLLKRSLGAVGDDRYVLWIAALQAADTDARNEALQRLRAAEADNAAVWMLELNVAASARNEARVDDALHHMADASRFDTYTARVMDAITDVYRRFPAPAELLAAMHDAMPEPSPEQVAVLAGLALSGARGMPAFQPLVTACRVDAAKGKNLSRRDDCGATGRLLMLHADTLLASHVGMSVLRVSKTYGEDDLRAARGSDWMTKQYMSLVPTDESAAAFAQFVRFHDDWVATGSEVTAIRRAVERAGLSLTPPDDWDDTQSVFAERRLRADGTVPAAGSD